MPKKFININYLNWSILKWFPGTLFAPSLFDFLGQKTATGA